MDRQFDIYMYETYTVRDCYCRHKPGNAGMTMIL